MSHPNQMYRILLWTSLASGIAWVSVPAAMTAEPSPPPTSNNKPTDSVAMVIDFSGTVMISTANGASPSHRMQLLRPGDQLRAENGQVKLIFLGDKHFEIIKSSSVTVGKLGCEPRDSVQRVKATDLQNSSALDALRKESGRSAAGFLRGGGTSLSAKLAVVPSDGALVISQQPGFKWPDNKTDKFEVVLIADGSYREIWRGTAKKAELAFPSDAPPLKRGRSYLWRVRWGDDKGNKSIFTSHFSVATLSEADELRPLAAWETNTELDKVLLAAVIYSAYGVNDKALNLFELLTKQAPDDPALWERYSYCLGLAGRSDEARNARQRARSLDFQKLNSD